MKEFNVESSETIKKAEVLKLLAHPIRFTIALALYRNEVMNVSSLQDALVLPQSTVSQHISKMRESGIVEAKRSGTKIFYSLTNPIAIKVIKCLEE